MTPMPTLRRRLTRLATGLLGAATMAAALVACGGGTSQLEPFQPTRVLILGDETSLLQPDGARWGVNGLNADDTLACRSLNIWVQDVLALYSFALPQCNPDAVASPQGLMRSTLGAKADDLKTQVDAQVAAGGFTSKDLVTVMVGAHDAIELYEQVAASTITQANAEVAARLRGQRVGEQVNRMVGLGARVIVATAIDMGVSPYAIKKGAAAQASLTAITNGLNDSLIATLINDGRLIGLVLADEIVRTMSKAPGLYGITNATDPACTTALPGCTSKTLATDAGPTTWLWADDTHLAAGAHTYIGSQAATRARNNPF